MNVLRGALDIKLIAPSLLAMFLCASMSTQRPVEPLRLNWCGALPRPEYKTLKRVEVHSDWFEVYHIRPGVYAVYEPHQFEEVISYLIVGTRRALLLDTGLGVGAIRDVVTALTKLPVTVLNSHTHFDHTGGNADFSDIWNEDTPYSRANAQTHSSIYGRDALAPERICGGLPAEVHSHEFTKRTWQATHWIHDREQIDLGGRQLQVLFTPGHTPDSVSLLDRQHGLLFTGDTFYPGPIYLFTPETDFAAYGRSVHRLAQLAPHLQLLLPSHNLPISPPGVLDEAVKKIQSGSAQYEVTDGRREYKVDGFSFLLSEK
jgi:glyoxylase-like metal-dependent hydrolase (beta-lactamase superfamily II)